MGSSGFKLSEFWEVNRDSIWGGFLGFSCVFAYYEGLGYVSWPIYLGFPFVFLLALYVNNRRNRRSKNINSKATLIIEAESTVSWQVLDEEGELLEQGSGQAQFLVPVSVFSTCDVSIIFRFLPEKWHPRLEQSRFCTYKPRMMYSYIVRTLTKSEFLVCELQLENACRREESLDGEAFLFLFIMNPVHMSRHWIWPDWFEIFNRQVGQE
jgi:hypothetical protein